MADEPVKTEWAYQSRTSRREGLKPTPCSKTHAEDRKALGYVILTRKVTRWVEKDE